MSKINFQSLEKEDKAVLDRVFKYSYHENSHLNFTNLFMWRKAYDIMWCIENDILYLKAVDAENGQEFGMQPICQPGKINEAIEGWLKYFTDNKVPFYLYGIEKTEAEYFNNYSGAEFDIAADRDNYDYVYNSADLINLSGRKFHSKKNHINSFKKEYADAQYLPITEEIITLCKLNINSWYKKHDTDDEIVTTERNAIIEVLNNFDYLKLKGGAVMLDKRVVAFTFGEQLNTDTAVIHVEKADPEVRGAYPIINQQFVVNEWSKLAYINREEDMGLEGLRKAKESYRPVKMIEKFNIKLK